MTFDSSHSWGMATLSQFTHKLAVSGFLFMNYCYIKHCKNDTRDFFITWDSLHTMLKSNYKVWIKQEQKK